MDAAFASIGCTEQGTNSVSVKAGTIYIVGVMGIPVIQCSKLQSYIVTSTMDAENASLPMFLRAAILLIAVTEAIDEGLDFLSPCYNFQGYCQ